MRTSSLPRLLLATGVVAASLSACDSTRQVASESTSNTVPAGPTIDDSDVTFNREVTQGDYRFVVKTFGNEEPRFVSIRSYRGSSMTMDPMRVQVTGALTNVASGDLNGNGKPELYLMTDNKKVNGGLYAYEFGERGYTPISFPGTPAGQAGMGYTGQDMYSISGNKLVRTFPVTPTDSTMKAGNRTVEYTLDANGRLMMGQSMDAQ
ncbi:hypothetical protein KLP40_18330 [Hymenobacter sp. NST-14]|uniref:hypothetical protein n=1 Tax=Hymenobacter piscis TaxID=2839984 RepID=UPI001C012BFB|nr:hypothetical protein [Hymenobacter piscis]MBT9395131.1 hypothetical protein [Hymenobacter piscis]